MILSLGTRKFSLIRMDQEVQCLDWDPFPGSSVLRLGVLRLGPFHYNNPLIRYVLLGLNLFSNLNLSQAHWIVYTDRAWNWKPYFALSNSSTGPERKLLNLKTRVPNEIKSERDKEGSPYYVIFKKCWSSVKETINSNCCCCFIRVGPTQFKWMLALAFRQLFTRMWMLAFRLLFTRIKEWD